MIFSNSMDIRISEELRQPVVYVYYNRWREAAYLLKILKIFLRPYVIEAFLHEQSILCNMVMVAAVVFSTSMSVKSYMRMISWALFSIETTFVEAA